MSFLQGNTYLHTIKYPAFLLVLDPFPVIQKYDYRYLVTHKYTRT